MEPLFLPEQIVYLKTDLEFLPRIVLAYKVSKYSILYELAYGTGSSYHYDFEITIDPDYNKKPVGLRN